MDDRFKNDRRLIDPHQYTSVNMSQLTSFGHDDMDYWTDCFNSVMAGNALDMEIPSFEAPQTAAHSTGPPSNAVANSPDYIHPTYTARPGLPRSVLNLPDLTTGDQKVYDLSGLQRDPIFFQAIHDSANGQTSRNYEEKPNCHHETRNHREPSSLRCQWKDCSSEDTFSNEGSLVRHLKAKHISPEKYRCPCGKSFGRKDRFRDHKRLKHSELEREICQTVTNANLQVEGRHS